MTCLYVLCRQLLLFFILLILTACAAGSESFVYTPADEPRPGPGLFSGPDGTFPLFQGKGEEVSSKPDVTSP